MNCPKCGGELAARGTRQDTDKTYRLRKCLNCGEKIYTVEQTTPTARRQWLFADSEYCTRKYAERVARNG